MIWTQRTAIPASDEWRKMIGPDEHCPGAARARLLIEQIPVWAIVGYVGQAAGSTEPAAITDEVIAQAAAAYEIPREAVRAALMYYDEHRGAIDALLEANAAAVG